MSRCELCGTTTNVLVLKNGGHVCAECRKALGEARDAKVLEFKPRKEMKNAGKDNEA